MGFLTWLRHHVESAKQVVGNNEELWQSWGDPGRYGETRTKHVLQKDTLGQHEVYTNMLVPRVGKSTSTSELDLVMLHEKGIYVFESKNYSGWIFGSVDQAKWTSRFKNGHKEYFFNPINQNRSHIRALAAYLQLPEDVFRSFIVFSDKCELKNVPYKGEGYLVCQWFRLEGRVRLDFADREPVFDKAAYEAVKARLDVLAQASTEEAKRAHVREVKAVTKGKKCPYCGRDLVERKNKSNGQSFIGCSGFPKCRYTRKA